MTWNSNATKSGLTMGCWYWYRRSATEKPFPVWVFDTIGIEYAWLCDPYEWQTVTERVENCSGEFLEKLERPQ